MNKPIDAVAETKRVQNQTTEEWLAEYGEEDPADVKKRTDQQNKALYLYFEMLAKTLNDAGLDMRVVLKPEVEIPWTKISVKEHLWRPIQKIMLDKESTTEANTSDYNKIYEVLHRHMAEKHGITVLWPHHSMQGFEEHWSK